MARDDHDRSDNDVRQPLLAAGGGGGGGGGGADPPISYGGSSSSPSPSQASSITAINSAPKEVTVEFDPNGDLENPQDWPLAFKWSIVFLLSMLGFITTFTCISMVPLASTIVDDLSSSSSSILSTALGLNNLDSPLGITRAAASNVLLVTIWELGEAAGPLLIAPLSELHGRYLVMNVANTLLILSTVLAATATSVPMFILARALTGLSVTANVLNPAIIGDMFPAEQRGSAVSMVFLAPLIGGAIGPGIATTIADWWGSWRAVVWICVVVSGTLEVFFLLGFRETYSVVILRRRVEMERKERAVLHGKTLREEEIQEEEQNVKLVVDGDAEHGQIDGKKHGFMVELKKLRDAVLRPAHVLGGSAVLMALSLLGSVLFSYYYVISVTLPSVLADRYGLSSVKIGWCFISFTVGSFLSVICCENGLDKIYVSLRDFHRLKTNNPSAPGKPEYRLPMTIIGAFVCPLAIAAYGWTAEFAGPLPLLLLSVAVVGASLVLSMVPVMAYIVDAFGLYSASAITGVIVTRCLMSTFLPLATGPLIDNYGYGWGFMAFSALSLLLAPISIVILRYGEQWRAWSKYTRESM